MAARGACTAAGHAGDRTAKRLELLRELRPQASVACLVNPSSPKAEAQLTDIREAVHTTGKEVRLLSVSNDHDLEAAFATLIREQIGALLLANDAFFVGRREQIVALAARHAIPTMYFLREFGRDVNYAGTCRSGRFCEPKRKSDQERAIEIKSFLIADYMLQCGH